MSARGNIRWFRFAAPDKRRPVPVLVLVLGRADVLPSLLRDGHVAVERNVGWLSSLRRRGDVAPHSNS